MRYLGIPAVEGKELGTVVRVEPMPECNIDEKAEKGEKQEETVWWSAFEDVLQELQSDLKKFSASGQKTKADIVDVQITLIRDAVFRNKVLEFLGLNFSAAAAVKRAVLWEQEALNSLSDDYIKERAKDVEDIGNRLICWIAGRPYSGLSGIDSGTILVAKDLLPSALMNAPRDSVAGIVLEEGSATSHVAILAGSMEIPTLVGCARALDLPDGKTVFLNASDGFVEGPLNEDEVWTQTRQLAGYRSGKKELEKWRAVPGATSDGRRIEVLANIMGDGEADSVLKTGADGVGLFRTEFLFLNRTALPTEEEQFESYCRAAKRLGGLSLTIRTIDIGADKKVNGLALKEEQNPALGYRAIRICADHEELFLAQLRAALRASAFGRIRIMFPMVGSLQEVRAARAEVEKAKDQLRKTGTAFDETVPVGMMVEIPSAAILADKFAVETDFFSIGSNDLTQYTLAADRLNAKVAPLYDYFHPAVLSLVERTIRAAANSEIDCSVCGEMASDPMAIPLLLGFGLTHFSMSPARILSVKKLMSLLNASELEKLARRCLELKTADEVRKAVSASLGENYKQCIV